MFPGRSKVEKGRTVGVASLILQSLTLFVFVSSSKASYSALEGKECVPPVWECSSPSFPDPAVVEYYLSPSGDDDLNDGLTPSSPWRTPSRALQAAAGHCGEVVVRLAGGHYGPGIGIDVSPQDSGEYAGREGSCGVETGWVTFLGEGGDATVLSHVLVSGVPSAKIAVRSLKIDGTHPGSSGDNDAVNVKSSSHVRLDDVTIDPSSDPLWTSYSAMPIGIHTRDASDVVVTRSSVLGGRYGAVLWGADLHLLECEIGEQFGDAVRVISASSVTVEGCLIRDVADYQNSGEHLDGIQFFAAGPAGSYPQPRDVVLRRNTFRNMAGQMIFVQSNWVDQIGYIENVVIESNLLQKKSVDDAAIPVQLQRVKNFAFEGNTVDGDVLIRDGSEGYVRDNLLRRLRVTTGAVLVGGGPTDHNVVGEYLTDSTASEVSPGSNSVIDPAAVVFADADNGDYEPQSIEACTGATDGLHAGAVPCDVCSESSSRWWVPNAFDDVRAAALFASRPARVPLGESAELVASASVSCTGSILTEYMWSTDDGQSFVSADPYSSVLLTSAGSHSVTLVVQDAEGNVSPPLTRTVVVEAPPEPGLLASYPLSGTDLADVSPSQHEAATYQGASGTLSLVPSQCSGADAVSLDDGASDYLQFPSSVRDSVNDLPSLTTGIFARPLSFSSAGNGQLFYKHVTVGIRVDAARVYCNVGTSTNGWWPEIKAVIPGAAHLDGNWHHFAVTYDSSAGEVRCYFDGTLVGTKASYDGVRAGTWPLTAGVNLFKSNYLKGDLAGMKLYDRALSEEEIYEWSGDPCA